MKKIFTALALAAVAVFGASAAELQDFFNQKIRPVSTMAINVPESELAEDGLNASSVAILSNEAMEKLMKEAAFVSPVELIVETKEGGTAVKVWMCPAKVDGNTEVLLFNSDGDNNVAVFASGPKDAVNKMLEE